MTLRDADLMPPNQVKLWGCALSTRNSVVQAPLKDKVMVWEHTGRHQRKSAIWTDYSLLSILVCFKLNGNLKGGPMSLFSLKKYIYGDDIG